MFEKRRGWTGLSGVKRDDWLFQIFFFYKTSNSKESISFEVITLQVKKLNVKISILDCFVFQTFSFGQRKRHLIYISQRFKMKGDIRTNQSRIFSPVLTPDMVFKKTPEFKQHAFTY